MTLEQNAQWVKYIHRTPEPENLTYADVVSRDSVRISLTYTSLNGFDVYACDIKIPTFKEPVPRNTS